MGMRRLILWAPLALFLVFAGLFASGLIRPSSSTIRSKLIGQPLPEFALPAALPGRPGLSRASFTTGKPRLLNIFASWCVPCAAESPQLLQLRDAGVPIEAIAIRDRSEDVARFLQRWGDPYAAIGSDRDSAVQLALGSSGVPETFVIDGRGIIRHQHIGDIRAEDVPALISAVQAAQ
ncbi:MAG: periplasmic protein thiol--disulfide oxidoreductase DsbE [Sphingomonas bacterium]|jgi:cytochrome c biogenesis protein CcmG/thiol:disulfide interchange protein DsbE|nr:periplasmic protein thiol--disulfide oxidoreductase DsbE [Sphingomonas bacterium]MDB5717383.1 periplasmic protein thiol--disulfide oxidoreductase DsbE [Sphingomonas bacterium]